MRLFLLAIVSLIGCGAGPAHTIEEIRAGSLDEVIAGIEAAPAGRYDLDFHTPGGSVFTGLEFIRVMENAKARGVVFYCTAGLVASMGVPIYATCNVRLARPWALFLIHSAWTTISGNAEELRKEADKLEAATDALLMQIATVTNVSWEYLKAKSYDRDWWFHALEAKEMDLVHEVIF